MLYFEYDRTCPAVGNPIDRPDNFINLLTFRLPRLQPSQQILPSSKIQQRLTHIFEYRQGEIGKAHAHFLRQFLS